jgi:hypothetical protein
VCVFVSRDFGTAFYLAAASVASAVVTVVALRTANARLLVPRRGADRDSLVVSLLPSTDTTAPSAPSDTVSLSSSWGLMPPLPMAGAAFVAPYGYLPMTDLTGTEHSPQHNQTMATAPPAASVYSFAPDVYEAPTAPLAALSPFALAPEPVVSDPHIFRPS